jgi:hypothetical protein
MRWKIPSPECFIGANIRFCAGRKNKKNYEERTRNDVY